MAVGALALVGFGKSWGGLMKRAARRFHRRYWLVFGLLVPVAFFAILSLKQTPPKDGAPVLLEEAQ